MKLENKCSPPYSSPCFQSHASIHVVSACWTQKAQRKKEKASDLKGQIENIYHTMFPCPDFCISHQNNLNNTFC